MGGIGVTRATEANHCATYRELTMRFVLWAVKQRDVPLPEQIADRFHVGYATAYRWRNDFCAATGREIPPPRGYGEAAWPPQARPRNSQARRQPAPTATPIQGPRNDP